MHMRRLVSIGGLGLATVLAVLSLPLWLPVALVRDLVVDRRLPWTRALVFLVGVMLVELAGLAGALVALRHRRDPARFVEVNYDLQRGFARAILAWATRVFDLRFEPSGDALGSGPFVLLPRHASLADTLLPMWLTDGPDPMRPRYALKKELLWDPCLDIVGNRVPNVFVDRSAGASGEVARVAALATDLDSRSFVVLFPEGTRFSESRRQAIIQRLLHRGDDARIHEARALSNVLPIRPGGAAGLLARQGLDVVLLAHSGLERTRSLRDVLQGDLIGCTISLQLRRIPAADVPLDDRERIAWLRSMWTWMDATVGELQRAA